MEDLVHVHLALKIVQLCELILIKKKGVIIISLLPSKQDDMNGPNCAELF